MAISPFNLGGTTPKVSPFGLSKPAPLASIAPAVIPPVSMGQKATTPTSNLSKPATTLPASQKAPSSPGMYNGVVITPGTDAQIQAQMATIDKGSVANPSPAPAASTASQTPSYPGLMGQQILKAQQQAAPPTFSGLVGNVAGQGDALNAQAGQLNSQAGTINTTAQQIGQQGQMTPEEARIRQQLAGIDASEAADSQNIETHPGVGGFAMGRDAINLQNQEAIRSSLGQQLAGFAAQRTANTGAYTAQANAQNAAGGLINSAGGLQNSAGGLYGNAAGYAQPQLGSIGAVPFSPLDQSQGSVLGSTQPGGIQAAGNLLGQLQGAQAAGAAPGQAQASNTQTTGTYGTQLAAQGGSAATQTYNSMNALYGAADTQAKNLQTILSSTGINSNNSSDYNKAINTLSGRLGSQNYTQFTTALTELQTMYQNLLSAGGGTPSGNEAQSLALLSPTASANQINGAIYQLQLAAQAKLGAQQGLANQYNSQLGGNTNGGATASGANPWH